MKIVPILVMDDGDLKPMFEMGLRDYTRDGK